jgi:hypothetical protein
VAPDRFVFVPAEIEVTFDTSITGRSQKLTLRQGGAAPTWVRQP